MAKITNNAAGARTVNAVLDGKVVQVSLKAGETRELDLLETKPTAARISSGEFKVNGAFTDTPVSVTVGSDETAELTKRFDTAYGTLRAELDTEKARVADLEKLVAERDGQLAALSQGGNGGGSGADQTPGYIVTDKGSGWFAISKDGAEVTKSLRRDVVAGFDAKSDDEKAAFVAANKPD